MSTQDAVEKVELARRPMIAAEEELRKFVESRRLDLGKDGSGQDSLCRNHFL